MSRAIRQLYDLAEGQAGYFTTAQAQEVGITRQLLQYHIHAGNADRVERGVYRLRLFPAQRFEDVMIACLWVGEEAAASHETALSIYELSDAMPATIHLTLPQRFRGCRRGVRVHHAPLIARERTRRECVPVTTVERTLVDVAVSSDPELIHTAIQQALARGATTKRRLQRAAKDEPALQRAILEALRKVA